MGDAVQILTVVGPLVVMLLLGAMAVRMAAKMCREVDSEHRRAEEVQRLATEPAALPNMRERVGVLMPDGSTCFAVVDIPGANEREAAEQARWEKAEADREALKRRLAGAPGADLENRGTEELVQALREQEAQAAAEQGLEYDQAVNACVRAPAELPGTPSSK